MRTTPTNLAVVLFISLCSLGLPTMASVDTQYSYAGDDFTSWINTACEPACNITGSLTLVAPLLSLFLLDAGLTGMLALRRRRDLWTVTAKISALSLALVGLATPARAQENIWLGQPGVPGPWSDLAQWTLGTVPASSLPDGSINIDIPQGTVLGDVSFTNSHTLTIEKAGQYNILSLTTVINAHGTGLIDNSGGLVNGGSLINELSASLFNDFGQLVNNGVISNELSASLENVPHGILINNSVISNQLLGIMDNAGFLDNMSGGLIANDISSTIDNSAIWKNESGATLSNFGAMKNSGLLQNLGFLNNAGSFANTNLLQIGSGGVLNNSGSISNVSGGGFAVQSGGAFNNSGSFLSDPFSAFDSQANSTILNTGTMTLGGNTVAISGSLRNNGTITMVASPAMGDPAIQPPAPPLLITPTGKLSGTGAVNQGLFGFGVINQGVMAPGDPLGTFTIIGNYQQTATGTLEIFLGGTGAGQFGQLDITGGADVSGTLDVELFAGFDPQAGEMFEILESGGITNLDFLSLLFPTLPDGLFFRLDREGNNLILDVTGGSGGGTSVPEPGTGALLLGAIATMFCATLLRKRQPAPRA